MPLRLLHLARDIKLGHSVFALPFALLAAFVASASTAGRLPGPLLLALVVACMVLARTVAMAVNRWADAPLDALNPRTARRAIPAGRLSGQFVLGAAGLCAALFVAAAAGFWWLDANPWPLLCAPAVLTWLVAYSFTKRFTWLCHLFLGAALSLSPIAAALAIAPPALGRPEPYLLALMVLCWVAGFDVLYALQDVEVDRRTAIFSMPATLGVGPALWIARGLHALSVVCLLVLLQASALLGAAFAAGVAAMAALLVFEHLLVWCSGTRPLHPVFFTVNGVISLLLGALGIADVAARLRG
jgi:4-hydroxybenzoate polyprenyltransferase